MTNPNIPTPDSIRARIKQGDEQSGLELLKVCLKALSTTSTLTLTVEIPQGTSEAGITWVYNQLSEAGYAVERWLGSQCDPANNLIIKC